MPSTFSSSPTSHRATSRTDVRRRPRAISASSITATLVMRPLRPPSFSGALPTAFGRRPVLMADVAALFDHRLHLGLRAQSLRPSSRCAACSASRWAASGASAHRAHHGACAARVPRLRLRPAADRLSDRRSDRGAIVYGQFLRPSGPHFEAWRACVMVSVIPALLVLYIRRNVPESPGWSSRRARRAQQRCFATSCARPFGSFALYAIVLMTAFNFFSHGTAGPVSDLPAEPASLRRPAYRGQLHLHPSVQYRRHPRRPDLRHAVAAGLGRRRSHRGRGAAFDPACRSISGPMLQTVNPGMLAVGAFLMQFFVQGAWGVIPAHLNELSPAEARATFPGFVYQLGNFIASYNLVLQTRIALNQSTAIIPGPTARLLGVDGGRGGGGDRGAHRLWPRSAKRIWPSPAIESWATRTNTSTRSAAPLSSTPPLARTSIFSDGTPSSISNSRITSARLSDSRRRFRRLVAMRASIGFELHLLRPHGQRLVQRRRQRMAPH